MHNQSTCFALVPHSPALEEAFLGGTPPPKESVRLRRIRTSAGADGARGPSEAMMRKIFAFGLALFLLAGLVALILRAEQAGPPASVSSGPALPLDGELRSATTPGLVPMTVYAVGNPNTEVIEVRHIFTDTNLFRYEFISSVPAGSINEYHVRDMVGIPSPFRGSMTLQSSHPFTAAVVGTDYSSSPTDTQTPTSR